MGTVVVDDVRVRGGTVRSTITPPPSLRRFFTGTDLVVEYDVPVEDVPEGILVIPTLAHVCPVAWTRGADVSVGTVDRRFADQLPAVRDALCEMYPEFMDGGKLRADELRDPPNPARRTGGDDDRDGRTIDDTTSDGERASRGPRTGCGSNGVNGSNRANGGTVSSGPGGADSSTGLLFTGGVDSTCSFVRNRERDPVLIGIRGWTVTDDEEWADYRDHVRGFAAERGLESRFVASNMLDFLDHPMLLAHYKRYLIGGWYSAVASGIGMLGLCAPLAYQAGLDDLRMASSHWDGIDLPWGSHPSIDENVAWTGTCCVHDGYELTRQEKLEAIVGHVREDDRDLELRVCNDRMDGNCGYCPKCCRTAIGLVVAGCDPTDYGLPFGDRIYEYVRNCFERGEWVADEDTRIMWEDIQANVDPDSAPSPAAAEFYDWVLETDFAAVVEESERPIRDRAIRAVARRTPHSIYSSLYPVYAFAKRRA